MLTIVSYNVHFGRKILRIADWFSRQKDLPDILCFQEFPVSGIRTLMDALSPGRFRWRFVKNFKRKKGQYGLLTVFSSARVQFIRSARVDIGTNNIEPRLVSGVRKRFALVTHVSQNGRPVTIANIHVSFLASGAFRLRQFEKVIRYVNSGPTAQKTPSVLLGDFNVYAVHRRFLRMAHAHGFANAFNGKTHRILWYRHQLDYVLYKHCTVHAVSVHHLPYSDHGLVRFTLTAGD